MYTIELTELAESDLNGITDERIRQAIRERIDRLAQEPEKQGKTAWARAPGNVLSACGWTEIPGDLQD